MLSMSSLVGVGNTSAPTAIGVGGEVVVGAVVESTLPTLVVGGSGGGAISWTDLVALDWSGVVVFSWLVVDTDSCVGYTMLSRSRGSVRVTSRKRVCKASTRWGLFSTAL